MNKFAKILIPVVAVLAIAFILNIIEKDVHIERSKEITGSLKDIQSEITDFEKFNTWSPWMGVDPEAIHEYKGPQGEVGAEYYWSGNDDAGTGVQKITSISDDRIDTDLEFTAPWESKSKIYYLFEEKNGNINVTWAYDGTIPVLMSLFMNMDDMIGSKYEEGLNSLQDKLSK